MVVRESKLIEVPEAEYLSLLSRAERASTLEGKYDSVVRERDDAIASIKRAQGELPKIRDVLNNIKHKLFR